MTADYDSLRKLAETVSCAQWYTVAAVQESLGTLSTVPNLDSRFIAACSPEVILALLDALQAAERERDEERRALAVVLDEANAKIRDDFYRDAWRCLVARVDCDGGQRMSEDEDEAVTTERIDREIARLLGVERERDVVGRDVYLNAVELIGKVKQERDEARAERDARPEITAEDAAAKRDDSDAGQRIQFALRAHARKAASR